MIFPASDDDNRALLSAALGEARDLVALWATDAGRDPGRDAAELGWEEAAEGGVKGSPGGGEEEGGADSWGQPVTASAPTRIGRVRARSVALDEDTL